MPEDDLFEVEARSGPAAAADRAQEMLDAGEVPEFGTRAHLLVALAEFREQAGDREAAEAAEAAYRQAVAEPGTSFPDARAYLARFLLGAGRAEEGEALHAELRKVRPRDGMLCEFVAGTLEAGGDLSGALRWAKRRCRPRAAR